MGAGNNLKSCVVNLAKDSWWDSYTDLGVETLAGKGDCASADANLSYVAGKKGIFILEEAGYQGASRMRKGNAGDTEKKVAYDVWLRTKARLVEHTS